ncbi:MAG: M20/M25/M40 family metallo-hydrolase [Planctomycetota bacterium]
MSHRLIAWVAAAATLSLLGAQSPAAADASSVPEDRREGFASIEASACEEWLTYLASDELGGRETGQPGYRLAAEYVAARFAEFGLEPVGDDGTFFQNVPFVSAGPTADSVLALVADDGTEILRLIPGEDVGGRISEASEQDLPIVDLLAQSAADVEDADLEGKAVLFRDESPALSRWTEATRALWRARPKAILTIDDDGASRVQRRVRMGSGRRSRVLSSRFRRPNTYVISTATAERIREELSARQGSLTLQVRVGMEERPAFGGNVVGMLRGSDPELQHEVVGVGSHLDHIGSSGGVINNGADDDGSGTTGVLAVARAFSQNEVKPRRSILFMCFSGEEKGLIGSGYYADHPIVPHGDMVAELQMDMIGRREEKVRGGTVHESADDNANSLHLIGTKKLSSALHELCLAVNDAHIGFDYEYDEEDVFTRSDHYNFAKQGIPIAFFFTGFHSQYHRPDDTVDKIDFPKLTRVARLVYLVAFELANADERPDVDGSWRPRRR